MIGLSRGIKLWAELFFFVLSQCTRLTDGQTEGRTDGRTSRSWLYRGCIATVQSKSDSEDDKNVKTRDKNVRL